MEVMKRSYLLLDGAGDNSVLFFSLIDVMELLVGNGMELESLVGTGWNRSSETDGITRRKRMESPVVMGRNRSS